MLKLAMHAVRVDTYSIGWLPYPAYERRHEQGRVFAVSNNAEFVGFALWSPNYEDLELRILQIWIRGDARLLLHGRALTTAVCSEAAGLGLVRIRLWCAEDLAANLFWEALGFDCRGWRHGRGRWDASRRHRLWTLGVG